jgi:hypothetical protein
VKNNQISSDVRVACSNILPGLDKMGIGIDITKLNLLPQDPLEDNGFRKRIYEFTCNRQSSYESPYEPGVKYSVPDQIIDGGIRTTPTGTKEIKLSFMNNYKEVRETFTSEIKFKTSFFFFSGSASQTYRRTVEKITNDTKSISIADVNLSAYEIDLSPHWSNETKLTNAMNTYIERMLTKNYNESSKEYIEFIETYGTHYFSNAKFGGKIRVVIEIDEKLNKIMTLNSIKQNVEIELKILSASLGIDFGFENTNQVVDSNFKSNTKSEIRYYGGFHGLSEKMDKNWSLSIYKMPWLLGGELRPITEFIRNERIREEMTTAIQIYLDKAYLSELQHLVGLYRKFHAYVENDDLSEIFREIESQNRLMIPAEQSITDIKMKVEKLYDELQWRLNDTKICMHWEPVDQNSKDCGAVNRTLCAPTNQTTLYYSDSTHTINKGCSMQWGLFIDYSPEWFKKVEICYTYIPVQHTTRSWNLNKYNQCKSDFYPSSSNPVNCAPVGNFTRKYYDSTYNIDNYYKSNDYGCAMAWMLYVPASVPDWMFQNVEICLKYRSMKESAYNCNKNFMNNQSTREKCRPPNKWLTYEDFTGFGNNKICDLSWSIRLIPNNNPFDRSKADERLKVPPNFNYEYPE